MSQSYDPFTPPARAPGPVLQPPLTLALEKSIRSMPARTSKNTADGSMNEGVLASPKFKDM
jgi:hypothetical protein